MKSLPSPLPSIPHGPYTCMPPSLLIWVRGTTCAHTTGNLPVVWAQVVPTHNTHTHPHTPTHTHSVFPHNRQIACCVGTGGAPGANMAWSLERTCSSYLKTWLLIISYTLLYLHSLDSVYIHLKHQSHLQILHLIYCLQSGTWSPLSLTLHVGKWVYYCCSFSACVCIFQSFGRKLLAWFLPLCM